MPDFALTIPKIGRYEGIPSVLLQDAFVAKETVNIREQDGEYRKLKGRAYEFYDSNNIPIVTPVLTYPITAVGGSDSDLDSYTKLCLHFDGIDAATAYSDPIQGALTFVGTAQLDTAQKVFGTASLLLDGNSDYITLPDSEDWNFGAGDFTVDLRAMFSSVTAEISGIASNAICSKWVDINNRFHFIWYDDNNTIQFHYVNAGIVKASYLWNWTPTIDTFYHIALVRDGSNLYCFVNGTKLTINAVITPISSSTSFDSISAPFEIGRRYHSAATRYMNGWIDEFRVSKGIARWTADFTPPASAYSQNKFTISGNHATAIAAAIVDGKMRVNGSTGNDRLYANVETITDVGGNTEIIVSNSIASSTADGNIFVGATPVLKYHHYKRPATNGTEYLFVATAYHIWHWDNTSKILTIKFTCGTPASVKNWQIVTHSDFNVYATNNVDKVVYWTGNAAPSADFVVLGSASGIDIDGVYYIIKAKLIISYQSYLILGYVTYSDSSIYNQRIHFSSRADTSDWDINGAGDAGLKDFNNNSDVLTAFGKWSNYVVAFKENYHYTGVLVTDEVVFSWIEEDLKVGAIGPDAIANDKQGRLYWLASDFSIREIRTPSEISIPVKTTLQNINGLYAEYAQAKYIPEYRAVYFAIPYGNSTVNNKIIELNTDTGNFFTQDMEICAFGDYTRQISYTWATLPYATYDEWGAAWLMYDINRNSVGYPYILCSDYSGNTFSMHQSTKDAGVNMTGTFVFNTTLTSQAKNLQYRKRVNNGATFIFNRKTSGTVTVYVQTDTKKAWTNLGTVSLVDTTEPEMVFPHLPFDTAFKNAKFKLESTDDMELIGVLFTDFEMEDER
jgi:hypothetical protein